MGEIWNISFKTLHDGQFSLSTQLMERNLPLTNTTQESLTIGSTNWWLIWVFTLTEGVKFLQCFFFFFFVGLRTTYKIPIHPTPPPQKKKKKNFVLQNRFLSPSQALSVDWKNDSGIYSNVCMMYSLFLWGDGSSHFPELKSIGLIYVYQISPQASLSKCKLMNCN